MTALEDALGSLQAAFWDPALHPRHPRGTETGGEFAPKGRIDPYTGQNLDAKSEGHLLFADKWEYLVHNGDVLRAPRANPFDTRVRVRTGARFEFPASQIERRREQGAFPFDAAAPIAVKAGEITGLPDGVLDPAGPVQFTPAKPLVETNGAFWKAITDPETGREKAFWFADSSGRPHHADMEVALREHGRDPGMGMDVASGYGTTSGGYVQHTAGPVMKMDPLDSMPIVRAIQARHRNDIRAIEEMEPVRAAALPLLSPEEFNRRIQASTRIVEAAITDQLALAYQRALRSVASRCAIRFERETTALTAAFDESKHPRHPKGTDAGGEFAPKLEIAFETTDHIYFGSGYVFLRDPHADDPAWDAAVAKGLAQPKMQRGSVAQADFTYARPRDGKRGTLELGLVLTDRDQRRKGHAMRLLKALTQRFPQSAYDWTAESASPAGLALLQKAVDDGVLKGELVKGSSYTTRRGPRGGVHLDPTKKFVGITAAVGDERAKPEPEFVAPDPDDIVPKALLAAEIEKRTEQIRRQVVKAVVNGVTTETGVSFDVGGIFADRILDKVGARVRDAELSTRDAIRTMIRQAQEEGWTVPETAAEIRSHIWDLAPSTATQLARTDLIGTSNASAIAAARLVFAGQDNVVKRWLATEDERTRETHVEADGQTVPLDSKFAVGGALMDYPGDPSGPDAEVCNCRCTVLFEEQPTLAAAAWCALTAAFDPAKHPRHPAGSSQGGEWAPLDGLRRTAAGDRLVERLADGSPENVRLLWDDEDPRFAIAEELDLNNAPSVATIERAKDAVRDDSRRELLRRYPSGEVPVYRGGEGTPQPLQSWSLNPQTALFMAGRDPARVQERTVPVGMVEAFLPALARGRWSGFTGEEEVLVPWGSLTAAFWDPSKHPRHPRGTDVGGEFAAKGTGWAGPPIKADPMYNAATNAKRTDLVTLAQRNGMTVDEYKRAVEERMGEWLEGAYVASRVPVDLLDEIAQDGRFKSQFETGASRGLLANDVRSKAEREMFGYSPQLPKEQRPIYGYVHVPGKNPGGMLAMYGEVELELKHDVRHRTTFTGGDSLNEKMVPSPIDAPSYKSAEYKSGRDASYDYDPLHRGPTGGWGSYVEAQIHGGVTLDDIAAVHMPEHLFESDYGPNTFPPGTPMWEEWNARNRALDVFRERGIPIEYDAGQP